MASILDQDRFFGGNLNASSPAYLVGEGETRRIINARFIEGAITNSIAFEEVAFSYKGTRNDFAEVEKQKVLSKGDVQLVAPLEYSGGQYLIMIISGRVFKYNTYTQEVYDITKPNLNLPQNSFEYPLSYIDNNGGVYGSGGYLVIFNGNNRPVFVSSDGVRASNEGNFELPPSRLGVTAGQRAFVASADNLVYASDPFGGSSQLAPLVFQETLDSSGSFYRQIYQIGSTLDTQYITAMCRLPNYLSPSSEFLARSVLVSTRKQKYILAASSPRASWDNSTFITYAGSTDGIAGPLACTVIGDNVIYITTRGRIKSLGQDAQRETNLQETFLDEVLGQYLACYESNYWYRDWYADLDHSRSIVKYNRDRLYATVYPMYSKAKLFLNKDSFSPTHRALATASLSSLTQLGPNVSLSWEGFYDWLQPIGIVTLGDFVWVVSKDYYGNIKIYKENYSKLDTHDSVIYTRGYFSNGAGRSKSIIEGQLYFRRFSNGLLVSIDVLVNNKWELGNFCEVTDNVHRFSFRDSKCKSDSASIPIRINVRHNGCRFELESIYVQGEIHVDKR